MFKWINIHPHLFFLPAIVAWSNAFASQNDAISPITPFNYVETEKVRLGKRLFEDKLFSNGNELSCASCHSLQKAGCDNLPTYQGLNKKPGQLNTPTVLNVSLNFRHFWDGRAKTLENVIDDHISNDTVFANNWEKIQSLLNASDEYKRLFKKVYSSEINPNIVKNALIEYLNILLTPDSPFDRYLLGDKSALTPDAQKGYELFQQYGCMTCHEGPNIGGNMFQRFGIYKNYFENKSTITDADLGRFNVTKKEQDKFVFIVPSLRNVAKTGPYLHDGSIKTLDEIVKIMGVYQVGQEIPNHEITLIVKFLESLSGKIPESTQEKR